MPVVEETAGGGEGEAVAAPEGEIGETPPDDVPVDQVLAPVDLVTDTSTGETVVEEETAIEEPVLALPVDETLDAVVEKTAPPVDATPSGDAVATGPPPEGNLARLQEENVPVASTPVD